MEKISLSSAAILPVPKSSTTLWDQHSMEKEGQNCEILASISPAKDKKPYIIMQEWRLLIDAIANYFHIFHILVPVGYILHVNEIQKYSTLF